MARTKGLIAALALIVPGGSISGGAAAQNGYSFTDADGATIVTLAGDVELGGVFSLVPARAFLHGIDANLTTLRRLLERGP